MSFGQKFRKTRGNWLPDAHQSKAFFFSKAKAGKTLFGPISIKLTNPAVWMAYKYRPEQFWNNCNIVYLSGLQNLIWAY